MWVFISKFKIQNSENSILESECYLNSIISVRWYLLLLPSTLRIKTEDVDSSQSQSKGDSSNVQPVIWNYSTLNPSGVIHFQLIGSRSLVNCQCIYGKVGFICIHRFYKRKVDRFKVWLCCFLIFFSKASVSFAIKIIMYRKGSWPVECCPPEHLVSQRQWLSQCIRVDYFSREPAMSTKLVK